MRRGRDLVTSHHTDRDPGGGLHPGHSDPGHGPRPPRPLPRGGLGLHAGLPQPPAGLLIRVMLPREKLSCEKLDHQIPGAEVQLRGEGDLRVCVHHLHDGLHGHSGLHPRPRSRDCRRTGRGPQLRLHLPGLPLLHLSGRYEGRGLDGRVPAVLHVPLRHDDDLPGHLPGGGSLGRARQELSGRSHSGRALHTVC